MAQIPIPTSTEPVVDRQTGHMRPAWRGFFERFSKQFASAERDLSGRPVTSQTVFGAWLIETPEDKDYPVVVDSPLAFTITSVRTKTGAGTATVTVKINGVALGGNASSAATTKSAEEHSSDNVVAEGDDITITVASTSNAEALTVVMAGTQELATE